MRLSRLLALAAPLLGFMAENSRALLPPTACQDQAAPRAKKLNVFLAGGYLGGDAGGFSKGEGFYYDLALKPVPHRQNDSGECEWFADEVRSFVRMGGAWTSGIIDDFNHVDLDLGWKYICTADISFALTPFGEALWRNHDYQYGTGGRIRLDYGDYLFADAAAGGRFAGGGAFKQTGFAWSVGLGVRKALWEEHIERK